MTLHSHEVHRSLLHVNSTLNSAAMLSYGSEASGIFPDALTGVNSCYAADGSHGLSVCSYQERPVPMLSAESWDHTAPMLLAASAPNLTANAAQCSHGQFCEEFSSTAAHEVGYSSTSSASATSHNFEIEVGILPPSPSSGHPFDVVVGKSRFCTLCQVWLNSCTQTADHVAGSRHHKRLRAHDGRLPPIHVPDIIVFEGDTETGPVWLDTSDDAVLYRLTRDTLEFGKGFPYYFNERWNARLRRLPDPFYYCHVCDYQCDASSVDLHKESAWHKSCLSHRHRLQNGDTGGAQVDVQEETFSGNDLDGDTGHREEHHAFAFLLPESAVAEPQFEPMVEITDSPHIEIVQVEGEQPEDFFPIIPEEQVTPQSTFDFLYLRQTYEKVRAALEPCAACFSGMTFGFRVATCIRARRVVTAPVLSLHEIPLVLAGVVSPLDAVADPIASVVDPVAVVVGHLIRDAGVLLGHSTYTAVIAILKFSAIVAGGFLSSPFLCGVFSGAGFFILVKLWHFTALPLLTPNTAFKANATDLFCHSCNPHLRGPVYVFEKKPKWYKRTFVPHACWHCSWIPFCYTHHPIEFQCSDSLKQLLASYSSLDHVKKQKERDFNGPLVNAYDCQAFTPETPAIQQWIGKLSDLEHCHFWFLQTHTGNYQYATCWVSFTCTEGEVEMYDAPYDRSSGLSESEWFHRIGSTYDPGLRVGNGARQEFDRTFLGPVGRMRQLWHFIEQHQGLLPEMSVTRCAFKTFRKQARVRFKDPVIDMNEHMQTVFEDLDPYPTDAAAAPPGVKVMASTSSSSFACGPVLSPTVVHSTSCTKTKASVAEFRHLPDNNTFVPDPATWANTDPQHHIPAPPGGWPQDPDQAPPLKFEAGSDVGILMTKMWEEFDRTVISAARVQHAQRKLFFNKDYSDIAISSFSSEDVQRFFEENEIKTPVESTRLRTQNCKLEAVVSKTPVGTAPNKAARGVVDNHLDILGILFAAGTILSHLTFSEDMGILWFLSVKHRRREVILDEVLDVFSQDDYPGGSCMFEIDQTGMERHQRCDTKGNGLFSKGLRALQLVCSRMKYGPDAPFGQKAIDMITYDVSRGLVVDARVVGENNRVHKKKYVLRFGDTMLDSGSIITSLINGINEQFACLVCMTTNPTHLFARNQKNRTFRVNDSKHVENSSTCAADVHKEDLLDHDTELIKKRRSERVCSYDFNYVSADFFSIPGRDPDVPGRCETTKIRITTEGDDGIGKLSRWLSDKRNVQLIEWRMSKLGFKSKVKVVVRGRAEFIGTHFWVEDGRLTKSIPWCPDFMRMLPKFGSNTSRSPNIVNTAARCLSLAALSYNRFENLSAGYLAQYGRLKDEYAKKKGAKKWGELKVEVKSYSDIARAFDLHQGQHLMQVLEDGFYERAQGVFPPPKVQLEMMNMSVYEDAYGGRISGKDYAAFNLVCQAMSDCSYEESEEVFSQLPYSLKVK